MDDLKETERLERLPCSWRYVNLCLLIPLLNGFINGYAWAGLALHYRDMGWPIARVGTPATCGFIGRIVGQKIQVKFGFWAMIPLGLIHLIFTILGVIFFDQEWAVIFEVAALQSLDGAITFEGMAFDAFGRTEDLARQAAATILSTFVISGALSVPIAGALYDNLGGWQSMSVAHLVCQGLLFILFTTDPGMRLSVREFFSKEKATESQDVLIHVVPGIAASPSPGKPSLDSGEIGEDMKLEDLENLENLPGQVLTSSNPIPSVRLSAVEPEAAPSGLPTQQMEKRMRAESDNSVQKNDQANDQPEGREGELQRPSRLSLGSGGTNATGRVIASCEEKQTPAGHGRNSAHSGHGRNSAHSGHGRNSAHSGHGRKSGLSGHGQISGQSGHLRISGHSGRASLSGESVWASRTSGMPENRVVSRSGSMNQKSEGKSIPRDTILPVLMISLCCFNTTVCNIMEVVVFALFFKEYHGWNSAMAIGVAQSAGDLSAALLIRVLPSGSDDSTSKVGFCRRIFMQPYNLSWLLIFWILCNLTMAGPWLVAAVTAQVLMGCLFVYSLKFQTDLALFYSLGDNGVLLTMQGWCKTFHNAGACFSSVAGPVIYSQVSPVAPFLVAGSIAATTFVIFTLFFACRVGLPEIESAEEQRARYKGIKRVSLWAKDGKP